jgi:hypothetical protein
MPLRSALANAGIFQPQDLALLSDVFSRMALEGDTDADRQWRAATLVRLYQSGATTVPQLTAAMGYEVEGAGPAPAGQMIGGVRREKNVELAK